MKLVFLVSLMFLIALSVSFSFDGVCWYTIMAISVSLQVVILIVTFEVAFKPFSHSYYYLSLCQNILQTQQD